MASFETVFHRRDDIPAFDSPWETPQWVAHMERYAGQLTNVPLGARVRALVRALRYGNSLPRTMTPLRALVTRNGSAPILDIGGGFGDNFMLLRPYMKDAPYTVIDGEQSCRLGRQMHGDNVTFASTPPASGSYGLAIIIGTLQYILCSESFVLGLRDLVTGTVFVSRSPLRERGEDFFLIQEITPGFETQSAGKCPIVVRSVEGVTGDFDKAGFDLVECVKVVDYSDNMRRLPAEFRDCAYYNMTFQRRAMPAT